jgi:hypothetical protein
LLQLRLLLHLSLLVLSVAIAACDRLRRVLIQDSGVLRLGALYRRRWRRITRATPPASLGILGKE